MTVDTDKYALICDGYTPRWYQKQFEEAMYSGYRRAFLLYHRRAGKDFCCWQFMLKCASNPNNLPGIYYYIFPTYTQGKKIVWDGKDESGKGFLDYIPEEWLLGKLNSTEMKVKLVNGSIIQIIGSDNPNAIRGTNPKGVVFSEYAYQDPRIWTEVVSPILSKNKGWAVFNTTPQGRNHAHDLWRDIQTSPSWFSQKLTIDDTKLITREQIENEEPKRSEELIEQEFYCSFAMGIDGTYYGRLINKARLEGRLRGVPYDTETVVHTAWDHGYGDSTAIVFYQLVGAEVHIIDYYENHGEQLAHYIKHVHNKPYVYGQHYFPHDAGAHEFGSGMTIQRQALELGLKAIVLPRDGLEEGIECARSMLSTTYIDEVKCAVLIKCLESYHKKKNEKMNVFSESPVHDWSSHGADAFRYCAMARNHFGKGSSNNMSPDKIREMRQKYMGY